MRLPTLTASAVQPNWAIAVDNSVWPAQCVCMYRGECKDGAEKNAVATGGTLQHACVTAYHGLFLQCHPHGGLNRFALAGGGCP